MTVEWQKRLKEAVNFLKEQVKTPPSVLMVLSGGLQAIKQELRQVQTFAAAEIPHFPPCQVEGHSGELLFGEYAGRQVAVCLGRSHYYEGHCMQDVPFAVHVLNAMGAKTLMITNSAGGINPGFEAGDIMLIRDHINWMGDNPLRGISVHTKYQFPDMTNAYPRNLRLLAAEVARKQDVELEEGVYLATAGPNYETPAEVRAFRQLGADAVGMSTVPEVIAANFRRMNVLGFSCIANLAADLHQGNMNHAEVLRAVREIEPRLLGLLLGIVERLGKSGAAAPVAANDN